MREPLPPGTLALDDGWRAVEALPADPGPVDQGPLPADLADELLLIARWLDRHAASRRLDEVSGTWASPVGWVPQAALAVRSSRRR
jgi:hypothetical protein